LADGDAEVAPGVSMRQMAKEVYRCGGGSQPLDICCCYYLPAPIETRWGGCDGLRLLRNT
jgi:hypothetical protein